MSNKHTFDSVRTVEKKNFDSIVTTKKNFDSSIIKSRFYDGILSGFYQNYGLFARFVQNNAIIIDNVVQNMGLSTTISVEQIAVSIGVDDILRTIQESPYFRQYNGINARLSQFRDLGTLQFSSNRDMSIIAMSEKMVVSQAGKIVISDIDIDAVMTVSEYYYVSEWDSSLLSVLDSDNLEDLEYQVV